MVSRGREGALLLNAKENVVMESRPPRIKPLNTVGAGDAVISAAASQIQRGSDPIEWLRWGVAAGTTCAQKKAGELPEFRAVAELASRLQVRKSALR